MKIILLVILICCIAFVLNISIVQTISDSNDTNMSVRKLSLVESDLSSSIYLNDGTANGNNLKFHWQFFKDSNGNSEYKTLRVAIEKFNGGGWATVGWGYNMFNGETIAVIRDTDDPTKLSFWQCTLKGWTYPDCRELTGFVEDSIKRQVTDNSFYVEFVRDLSMEDGFSNRIKNNKRSNLIFCQTPNAVVEKHQGPGMYGMVVIEFKNDAIYPTRTNYNFWTAFHDWAMVLCWTIGIDLFLFMGRYVKTVRFYHYIHSIGFGTIGIITFVSVFALIAELIYNDNFWIYPGHSLFKDIGFFHYWLGVIVIFILFVQMFVVLLGRIS